MKPSAFSFLLLQLSLLPYQLTYNIRAHIEVGRVDLMAQRRVAYAPPAVVVGPVGIGSLVDELTLQQLEIIAQAFVLQGNRQGKGLSKRLSHTLTLAHTHNGCAHGDVEEYQHGARHKAGERKVNILKTILLGRQHVKPII